MVRGRDREGGLAWRTGLKDEDIAGTMADG